MNIEKYNYLLVLALFIAVFTSGADSFIISPLLPEISKSLNCTIGQVALSITIYALFYAFGAPFFGPLGDRYNRKNIIVLGLGVFFIGTLSCGFVQNLMLFYIFRGLAGLGASLYLPNIWAFNGAYFSGKQLNQVMGIVMSALSLSIAIGVPLGTFLAQLSDWHMTFFVSSILAIISLLLLIFTMPNIENARKKKSGYLENFMRVVKTRNAVPALLITLFWMFGFYSIYTFLGSTLVENFGLDLVQTGNVFIAYGLFNFLASFFGSYLMNKIGHKESVLINGFMSIIFTLGLGFSSHNLILALVFLVLLAICQGLGVSALTTYVVGVVPDNRSTVMAFNSTSLYLGLTLGSSFGGLIFQNYGFSILGIFAAIGLLFSVLITKRLKK